MVYTLTFDDPITQEQFKTEEIKITDSANTFRLKTDDFYIKYYGSKTIVSL